MAKSRIPTKPFKMPRPAVKVVRSVRRIANSSLVSDILKDWQLAVVKCVTKDFSFVACIGLLFFLSTVNLFDIKTGPMKDLFAPYMDTALFKWAASNVLKMNGLMLMVPVVFKVPVSARLAGAVAVAMGVIVLNPATAWTYGVASLLILVALELKHFVNLSLVVAALGGLIVFNALGSKIVADTLKQPFLANTAEWAEFVAYKASKGVHPSVKATRSVSPAA